MFMHKHGDNNPRHSNTLEENCAQQFRNQRTGKGNNIISDAEIISGHGLRTLFIVIEKYIPQYKLNLHLRYKEAQN